MLRNKINNLEQKHPWIKYISRPLFKLFGDDIFGMSAELTFYLTMSFFPFVILLLALISITPLSAEETLFPLLSVLPSEVYKIVVYVLTGVERSTSIIVTSSIIAMWSVSGAASTINKSLNKMYKTSESRNRIVIRSIGFIFTILFACTIISTFALLVLGNLIGNAIMRFWPSFHFIWNVLRIVIAYSALMVAFAVIYKVLPNKDLKFRTVAIGAIFSTILWSVASMIFSFYVDNFSSYHIIYGSLTGMIALISWLYMSSFILLTGGELNSMIYLHSQTMQI